MCTSKALSGTVAAIAGGKSASIHCHDTSVGIASSLKGRHDYGNWEQFGAA